MVTVLKIVCLFPKNVYIPSISSPGAHNEGREKVHEVPMLKNSKFSQAVHITKIKVKVVLPQFEQPSNACLPADAIDSDHYHTF